MTQEHLLHGCGFNEPVVVHSKNLPSLTAVTAALHHVPVVSIHIILGG